MTLDKPFVGDFKAGQTFGQNFNDYYAQEGLKGHQGIDFPMPNGTPVVAAVNGTVIIVNTDIQKGEGVAVLSDDVFQYENQDCNLDTIYWHLKDGSMRVKVGDKVKRGDLLALSNNTGQSTGPHLHFSIIPMAPDGSRRLLSDVNNGYRGCIDPMPYLELPVPVRTLVAGMEGADVKDLQVKLNAHGANLKVDEKFGLKTLRAVQDFQSKCGLTPDGKVGPLTRSKLSTQL